MVLSFKLTLHWKCLLVMLFYAFLSAFLANIFGRNPALVFYSIFPTIFCNFAVFDFICQWLCVMRLHIFSVVVEDIGNKLSVLKRLNAISNTMFSMYFLFVSCLKTNYTTILFTKKKLINSITCCISFKRLISFYKKCYFITNWIVSYL